MDFNRLGVKTQAYGLIELLLVTAAASLLFVLLIKLFLQLSQTTFRVEQQAAHNQVVYFPLAEMQRDIRMARYLPCGQTKTQTSILKGSENSWWQNPFDNQLRGYEATQLPQAIVKDAIKDHDALMILRAGKNRIPIKSYKANRFVLAGEGSLAWLRKGALLIACDPNHTVLFQAGAVDLKQRTIEVTLDDKQIPGNCSQALGPALVESALSGQCLQQTYDFQTLSYITDYYAAIYYLSKAVSGKGRSIYREALTLSGKQGRISSRREELASGIAQLSFRYDLDIDRDGYAELQRTAAEIRQQSLAWSSVSAVEILLQYEPSRQSVLPAVSRSTQSDHSHVAIR